ncbi:MAG: hypothetical protein LBH14_04495 [Desulfobulbaceae bacterium]|jgi:2',3'-cyclic-nucleotide 2'-phosphodiesterase (5'-nucleotidase family)|nr:hypothetical protein [Desulfobulbaceae bacterium]
MKDIGADNAPSLRLDAGNDLCERPVLEQRRQLTVAKGIIDIYVAMGYDAVAVGANDLAVGVDLLKKNRKLTWLSANLRDQEGQVLFPASVVLSRGALRIGVIGLTGAVPANETSLRLADWRPRLTEAVNALRRDCHLLVVLSNLSATDEAEMMNNYPDIDLIITADSIIRGNITPRSGSEGKPWQVQTISEGKALGVLTLSGKEPPPSIPMNWENKTATVPLVMTLPEDPAIADMVRRIEQASAAQ